MSDQHATPELSAVAEHPHAPAAEVTPPAPADFNPDEVAWFRKDDGTTMKVIGVGLVVFFFYSLLVMLVVSVWTFGVHHPTTSNDASHSASHTDDEEGYGKETP